MLNIITGSAYIFLTSDGGATYSQTQKLIAVDGASSNEFGRIVAVYDSVTAVTRNSGVHVNAFIRNILHPKILGE